MRARAVVPFVAIKIEPVIVRLRERRCGDCGRFWACEFEFHGTCPLCAIVKLEAAEKERLRLVRAVNALQRGRGRKSKTREKT